MVITPECARHSRGPSIIECASRTEWSTA